MSPSFIIPDVRLEPYRIREAQRVLTPALERVTARGHEAPLPAAVTA